MSVWSALAGSQEAAQRNFGHQNSKIILQSTNCRLGLLRKYPTLRIPSLTQYDHFLFLTHSSDSVNHTNLTLVVSKRMVHCRLRLGFGPEASKSRLATTTTTLNATIFMFTLTLTLTRELRTTLYSCQACAVGQLTERAPAPHSGHSYHSFYTYRK